MENITYETMQKLKSVGFSYPDYEHFLNSGMMYDVQGEQYLISGNSVDGFSEQDRLAAQEGCWLPDGEQLLKWLQNNGFAVTIQWDAAERYFHVMAKDGLSGTEYSRGGPTFADALALLIYKICNLLHEHLSAAAAYWSEQNIPIEIYLNQKPETV